MLSQLLNTKKYTMETEKRIIEIDGVKIEVDLRTAKKEYWDSGNFSRKPEILEAINSALEKSKL